jgi:sterol desaturase/sphingolipid hydroxylase (fatty acid hydroxylase superfamily)
MRLRPSLKRALPLRCRGEPASPHYPALTVLLLSCRYVAYDMTHYLVHHAACTSGWLEPLSRAHMQHHFRDHSKGYGITTSFFDWVFGSVSQVQHIA